MRRAKSNREFLALPPEFGVPIVDVKKRRAAKADDFFSEEADHVDCQVTIVRWIQGGGRKALSFLPGDRRGEKLVALNVLRRMTAQERRDLLREAGPARSKKRGPKGLSPVETSQAVLVAMIEQLKQGKICTITEADGIVSAKTGIKRENVSRARKKGEAEIRRIKASRIISPT